MRRLAPALILPLLLAAPARPCRGQAGQEPAVQRGAQYLRGKAGQLPPGEAALAALALVKAEVPHDDPALVAQLRVVLARFSGTAYNPALPGPGGTSVYEASVTCLLLANLDPVAYKPQIDAVANYMMTCQLPSGGWDYPGRSYGDTSISQYAVLGLWEAENAGTAVHPRHWDRAAAFYLRAQGPDGGWTYHRDQGGRDTVSMTAAGVGSLLICQGQLANRRVPASSISPLLMPVVTDPNSPATYKAETTNAAITAGVNRGIAWIAQRFNPAAGEVMGQSAYYGLYGIERIGALADRQLLGGSDWFDRGKGYLLATQRPDGSWSSQHGEVPNTAWGVLFLTKSTAKSVRRIEIKRLGAGTLIGGRGLPKDLTSLTVAGGRVLARPMNGAVEEMLAVLEDPRSEEADAALSGLVSRYRSEGPPVLRPHNARFRKLLNDPDPGIRSVAAWGLGRIGDIDAAPDLIRALTDADETVVAQARQGLQILSRKIDGYGPPPGATPEQRQAAARRWRQWYDSARASTDSLRDPDANAAVTVPAPSS